jgi:arylsulfatase A-like enzyme
MQLYGNPSSKRIGSITRWERSAEEVNGAVFEWLNERRDSSRKFFLMVHYFDPHSPYRPPPHFHPGTDSTPELYDGEVRYVDQEIGRLLDKLEELDLTSETLILLTADHGESLGEHKLIGHKWKIYDEVLRVPLIVAGPGVPEGKRIAALVHHVDLAPALLDYCEAPIPSFFQGKSWMPLLEPGGSADKIRDFVLLEKATPSKHAYESQPEWQKYPYSQWAIRTETEKFIWSSDNRFEYYNLQKDPGELRNLFRRRNGRAMRLYRLGSEYRAGHPKLNLASHPGRKEGDDADAEEILRSLGYLN